jgi:UDP-4-amino-4,6-dideoxy-N-acetyl-beta-L-altrosamine transaminase
MIPYGRQSIDEDDIKAVVEALRDPLLTQGPAVQRFEEELARTVSARYAVAVNSGTAALHCAYAALGVGVGTTVVTSPISFVATANAALYLGADVEFVDADPETGLMSLDALRLAKAGPGSVVAPVHLTGHPVRMPELQEIATERGWRVVEDAAHALGGAYEADGRLVSVGSCAHSDLCEFSFHPVKHITTGEGGAITTNDERLYRSMLRFRSHGITRESKELRHSEGAWYYEQQELGFNYRITDFQCALGLSQLRRLDRFVRGRRDIAARYHAAFEGQQGLELPIDAPWARSSYHLYAVRVDVGRRRKVFDDLRTAGIGVNVHYIPIHQQPYYVERFGSKVFAGAERYSASTISLPMFPDLSAEDQGTVIQTVREVLR